MVLYIAIFIAIGIIYFLSAQNGGMSKSTFACIMIFLALFVGLGDMLGGYDRYIYAELFDRTADHYKLGEDFICSTIYNYYTVEFGYGYLNWIIAHVTANRYIFILLVTLLMYYLFYRNFIEETDNYGFAILLFLGLHFFFTFTYLRQALAVALIGFSYRYIVRRNLILYCLFVALATLVHNSAVLFFPMYWLCWKIPSKPVIIVGAVLCTAIGLTSIPSNLFDAYSDISEGTSNRGLYIIDGGVFRIEYVFESVIFLIFLLINHNPSEKNRRHISHYNIALCFCAILLIFNKSLNGGRLSWPFIFGVICAVTPKAKNSRGLQLNSVALICIGFLLYLRVLSGWGALLYPYKTFLTPGVRENDYIHTKYEYDYHYDDDKFYR